MGKPKRIPRSMTFRLGTTTKIINYKDTISHAIFDFRHSINRWLQWCNTVYIWWTYQSSDLYTLIIWKWCLLILTSWAIPSINPNCVHIFSFSEVWNLSKKLFFLEIWTSESSTWIFYTSNSSSTESKTPGFLFSIFSSYNQKYADLAANIPLLV